MKRTIVPLENGVSGKMMNGIARRPPLEEDDYSGLSPEDRELEMMVICSGELTDEVTILILLTRR